MYVERIPNRTSPPAILLRESYRQGDKFKRRTLANLSDWPAAKIEALRRVLRDEAVVPADQQALTLLQQDVLEPWAVNRATQISGRFTARGSSVRTYRVSDTLDGTLTAAASSTPRVRVQILSGTKVVARGGSSATTTICGGSRSFSVRVTRLAGSGAFTLSLSRP